DICDVEAAILRRGDFTACCIALVHRISTCKGVEIGRVFVPEWIRCKPSPRERVVPPLAHIELPRERLGEGLGLEGRGKQPFRLRIGTAAAEEAEVGDV